MNFRGIGLGFAAVAVLGGGASADDRWRPDDLIMTKTQIALFSVTGVEPAAVSVDSSEGAVTLVGTVPSVAAKEKVVQTARGIEGVKSVRDQLQVSTAPPPPAGNKPAMGTDELRGEVLKKLAADPKLRDNPITVRAEPNGVVALGGAANSLDDQLRALRIARGTAGVERVQDDMKSPPDTLYNVTVGEGAAAGADVHNRRERQARDGRAAEPMFDQAGDAPQRDADEHPAAINPEGDTVHSPRTEE